MATGEIVRTGRRPRTLNYGLLRRRGLSPTTIAAIEDEHVALDRTVEDLNLTMDGSVREALVERVERHEFRLQELWGFPSSAATHTHWLRPTACTCNKSLNMIVGSRPFRIVADDCPLHAGRSVTGVVVLSMTDFERWQEGADGDVLEMIQLR